MALNQLYVASSALQEYLVDKNTGEPLSNGKVYFKSNNNHSAYKNVYQLVGEEFVALPNPLILSDVGTAQDNNGNDIVIYYYPYDDNGDSELYYVEVYSSGDVLQFTRTFWPPNAEGQGSNTPGSGNVNFVPNPQFLTYNQQANDNYVTPGTTVIASGGWEFILNPDISTSQNLITFETNNSFVGSPPQSPLNELRIRCTLTSGGDSLKALRLKFLDANKFASDSQYYTYGFYARTGGSAIPVTLKLKKYFGVGGSAFPETVLANFTISSVDYELFQIPFLFGLNDGYTFGTGESYVALDIEFNIDLSFDLYFSDFMLLQGDLELSDESLPVQTDADTLTRAIAGWMDKPDPTGQDLYLPLVRTPYGLSWDRSQIGKVYASFALAPDIGELACDGSTYFYYGYSDDGIPYSRLGEYFWNDLTYGTIPLFGTGRDFITSLKITTTSNEFYVYYNKAGANTPIAATGATPFTITTLRPGGAFDMPIKIGRNNGTSIGFLFNTVSLNASLPAAVSAGTTGWPNVTNISSLGTKTYSSITVASGYAGIANGAYFTIRYPDGTTTVYVVYWRVDAALPAPPGASVIYVPISSNDNVAELVTDKTILSIQNGWVSRIICPADVSGITNGDTWTFGAGGENFTLHFQKNAIIDKTGVDLTRNLYVTVTDGMTATNIRAAIVAVINKFAYGVPDLRGWMLRGNDEDEIEDPNSTDRISNGNVLYDGAKIGTWQNDVFSAHAHTADRATAVPGVSAGFDITTAITPTLNGATTNLNGASQNRPLNVAVNWVIKY